MSANKGTVPLFAQLEAVERNKEGGYGRHKKTNQTGGAKLGFLAALQKAIVSRVDP